MSKKVAITGFGIVSAIGWNAEENLNALLNNRHGISKVALIDTKLKEDILVGEIKKSNEALLEILGVEKAASDFSRTTMLGAIAARQAIRHAGINIDKASEIGFVNATTVGGMDIIERYHDLFEQEEQYRHYIGVHDAGKNTGIICQYLGIRGFSTTISTACSSSANAIMMGAKLIKSKRLDKVVVGGMDALSKFTMNGFNTLKILSDSYNQPFDENRKGLNLGEGAAYLVLESEQSYKSRGQKPLAYLSGYANANDAYHQTASSENGDGAYLAMKHAIEEGGLHPQDIDYVNVHGTATRNNDLSEGRAMVRLFGHTIPTFSSTKPFTGHTLAAAGAIEAVFSILALHKNIIFPNLNFKQKMKEFDLTPQVTLTAQPITSVLSNSFGFGSNSSSLIFEKTNHK